MELRDVLRRRRMVRNYDPQPIPRETIERIVGTIRRAPSGGFSQGQRLVVVTDEETRKRIAELAGEAEHYVPSGLDPWISRAPVHVLVCTREEDYHDRYRRPDKLDDAGEEIEWPVPYWWFDAGALFMLVLLAAIDEGLSAGVFGAPRERLQEMKELLGIPADVEIGAIVTLGRGAPDRSDELSSRGTYPRKPLDELVHWERW
jgi:FMN reductase [NAD(P)H]